MVLMVLTEAIRRLGCAGGIGECKGGKNADSSTLSLGGRDGRLLSLNELVGRLDSSDEPGDNVVFAKGAGILAR